MVQPHGRVGMSDALGGAASQPAPSSDHERPNLKLGGIAKVSETIALTRSATVSRVQRAGVRSLLRRAWAVHCQTRSRTDCPRDGGERGRSSGLQLPRTRDQERRQLSGPTKPATRSSGCTLVSGSPTSAHRTARKILAEVQSVMGARPRRSQASWWSWAGVRQADARLSGRETAKDSSSSRAIWMDSSPMGYCFRLTTVSYAARTCGRGRRPRWDGTRTGVSA